MSDIDVIEAFFVFGVVYAVIAWIAGKWPLPPKDDPGDW